MPNLNNTLPGSVPLDGGGFDSKVPWITILAIPIASIMFLRFFHFLFQNRLCDNFGNTIPQGPVGLPILGCFPFLTHYPELTLDKWAKKFGALYSCWIGNQLFVVISSPDIAKDLLVTNGAIFSSRKDLFMKSQTVFAGRGITATPYNDTWRNHRRIATTWLHQKAVDQYTHVLEMEATDMVYCLFKASQNGSELVNPQPFAGRCSLNNMLTIVFGIRTDSVQDPLVQTSLRLSREFMNTTGPVSNLVDYVPLLQRLPSAMHSRGRQLHQDLMSTYGGMINEIRQHISLGKDVPDCLVKTMLTVCQDENLDDVDMAMLASAFMIGGVETSASIMQWFSALIPSYPEIQSRAQEELDIVVGRNRLPDIEDEQNLPFCRAVIKEVERCHNPFWLGTPHVASEDFTYNGNFIPKDTVLVLNTWSMHHNEKRYPEAHTFNPDRYIHDNFSSVQSSNLPDPNQRDHWMFGAGRRICPAIGLAEREIWLSISRMLWAFNMEAVPGQQIDLKEYDGLSGRSPVPFHIYFKPRDENVAKVLAVPR